MLRFGGVWKVFFLIKFFFLLFFSLDFSTQNFTFRAEFSSERKERGMDLELSVREVDAKR